MSDKPAYRTFEIHVLGSSAATPTSLRHTTAQAMRFHSKWYLLDCAEGTQMQMRRMKIPMMRIHQIFISHLHGDHYLGLPGLLFSMHLLGRKVPLHVYSPPGLREVIEVQFRVSGLVPQFETVFHEVVSGGERVFEDANLVVESLEMEHRIPCFGFLFREKPMDRNIKKDSISRYGIPVRQMPGIKEGEDLLMPDGTFVPNAEITTGPPRARSYAFCSDTAYTEKFLPQVQGADLLYHEATFLQDKADIAKEKTHSTTIEAATLAKKAGAGQLMLGHYSARYKDMELFLQEAREVFPNTILAEEGQVVKVGDSS
jgi:ribonuclease Z